MNNIVKFAAAAAAVIVAGVVGVNLLPGTAHQSAAAPAATGPSPHETASSGPRDTASPSPSPGSSWDPVAPKIASGPLAAGRHHIDVPLYARFRSYTLVPGAPEPSVHTPIAHVRVSFDLPDGWSGDGKAIAKEAGSRGALALTPWTVSGLIATRAGRHRMRCRTRRCSLPWTVSPGR